jgi:hypothetical protein
MTIAHQSLALLASVALASTALGQQSHGAGISGGSGLGTSIDYVREHWGPPDSVRLAAAVIWSGHSVWNLSVGEGEAAASRALQDSASRTSAERHRLGGGTVTTRANAWLEYDESARTVYVWNQPFRAASRDSTLVLLVENVDGVDGAPRIASVMVAHAALPGDTGH